MVRFDQGGAGLAGHAVDGRGVISWREVDEDRRIEVITGCKTGAGDRGLLRLLPIIVGGNRHPRQEDKRNSADHH
jgi:hypothetical protein